MILKDLNNKDLPEQDRLRAGSSSTYGKSTREQVRKLRDTIMVEMLTNNSTLIFSLVLAGPLLRASDGIEDISQKLIRVALENIPTQTILQTLSPKFSVTKLPSLEVKLARDASEIPATASGSAAYVLREKGKPRFLVINSGSRMWTEILISYRNDPLHSAAPYILSALLSHEITHGITNSTDDVLPYKVELAVLEYYYGRGYFRNFSSADDYIDLVRRRLATAQESR